MSLRVRAKPEQTVSLDFNQLETVLVLPASTVFSDAAQAPAIE
jgi:hypothetical protein